MSKQEQAQKFADRQKHNCKCAMKDNDVKSRGPGSGMRGKGFNSN